MRLSDRQKTNIRHFIYYLVNGTLNHELLNERLSGKYYDLLKSDREIFYKACCVFINQETRLNPDWPQVKRIAEFICKSVDPINNKDLIDLENWETDFLIHDNKLESEFKLFTKWLIETPIVDNVNYSDYIEEGASFLEQCYAIWTNVIEYKDDTIHNPQHGRERVVEYIKSYYIQDYKDNLKDWECELL